MMGRKEELDQQRDQALLAVDQLRYFAGEVPTEADGLIEALVYVGDSIRAAADAINSPAPHSIAHQTKKETQ